MLLLRNSPIKNNWLSQNEFSCFFWSPNLFGKVLEKRLASFGFERDLKFRKGQKKNPIQFKKNFSKNSNFCHWTGFWIFWPFFNFKHDFFLKLCQTSNFGLGFKWNYIRSHSKKVHFFIGEISASFTFVSIFNVDILFVIIQTSKIIKNGYSCFDVDNKINFSVFIKFNRYAN